MPDRFDERGDALSEAILRLLRRQEDVERRLATIESRLGLANGQRVERQATAPPPEPVPKPAEAAPPPPPEPPAAPRPGPFETRMGLTWVNRVGVVTLVLGVAFFFKYAVDNRWIGEAGRVVIGAATGLLAIAGAERFRRRAETVFAQGICGAGVAILYVSFYAAYGFYRLMPHAPAFALMALTTAGAALLALRYGSVAIAALGLIGGYLTPVVLSTGQDRPWALFFYVLVLDAGARAMARLRRWPILDALAFVATATLYWFWILEFNRSDKTAAIVFALVYYGLFAATELWPVAGTAQVNAVVQFLVASAPDGLLFLLLALMVSAAGLAIAEWRRWRGASAAVFLALAIPYAVGGFSLREQTRPEAMFAGLTFLFLLFFAWVPWRALVRKAAVDTSDLLMFVLNAGWYFIASYEVLQGGYRAWLGLFAVGLAVLHLLLGRELYELAPRPLDPRPARLATGAGVALFTIAIPVEFSSYRMTMGWAIEGAALAWIGARMRSRALAWASIGVLALGLVRLLAADTRLYADPAAYRTLWNARFLTFAIYAGALFAAARWLHIEAAGLGTYIAGHFVLLWALMLEVFGWAARTAAPADLGTLRSTAASILSAGYAVMLVGLGVALRSALNRALGLGLIVVVVLKLYLYDVWQIRGGMYRVAAFAVLGALLLIVSYLYSRFRGSIESWWRDRGSNGSLLK